MRDEDKYKILRFVKEQPWDIKGIGSNTILEFLVEAGMDIKTGNIYINTLVSEGWLETNPYGHSSYKLSDNATIWVNEYEPQQPDKEPLPNKWSKANTLLNAFTAIASVIAAITGCISLYFVLTQNNQNTKQQRDTTDQQRNDTNKSFKEAVPKISK